MGAQPGQSDRDEPADRGLGRQAARRRECMEAVAGKLVGRDILPNGAGLRGFGQQVSDQVVELQLRPDRVFTSMQEHREFGARGVLDVAVNAALLLGCPLRSL